MLNLNVLHCLITANHRDDLGEESHQSSTRDQRPDAPCKGEIVRLGPEVTGRLGRRRPAGMALRAALTSEVAQRVCYNIGSTNNGVVTNASHNVPETIRDLWPQSPIRKRMWYRRQIEYSARSRRSLAIALRRASPFPVRSVALRVKNWPQ